MERQDLRQLADDLTASSSEADAYFGIFCHGGGPDQSHFKGNEDGIKLFTSELLRALALRESGETISGTYPLDCKRTWLDPESEVMVDSIEFVSGKRDDIQPTEPPKSPLKDQALLTGCILLLILGAVFAVIGVVATVQWLF